MPLNRLFSQRSVPVQRTDDAVRPLYRCSARYVSGRHCSCAPQQQAGAFDPSIAQIGGSYSHLATSCYSSTNNPSTTIPVFSSSIFSHRSSNVRHHRQDPGCGPCHHAGPAHSALRRRQRRAHSLRCMLNPKRLGHQNANLTMTNSLANPSSSAPSTTPPTVNNTPVTLLVPPLPASRPPASTLRPVTCQERSVSGTPSRQ